VRATKKSLGEEYIDQRIAERIADGGQRAKGHTAAVDRPVGKTNEKIPSKGKAKPIKDSRPQDPQSVSLIIDSELCYTYHIGIICIVIRRYPNE
jgi:hypothetical protein